MAVKYEIEASNSYATAKNAEAAAMKKFGDAPVRFFIHTLPDGRFAPVFIGQECLQYGIHFHFNVIG